jgi:hypothetical protein
MKRALQTNKLRGNYMRVMHDYGLVRIVRDGDPFVTSFDIKVQVKENDQWVLYHGFNTLSDDYAYTNAREAAGRAIKSIAAAKASELPGVNYEDCSAS